MNDETPESNICAGKNVYLITHAYYHILGEIVQMLGTQRARLKNCRMVQSSRLGWGDFFAQGCTRTNSTVHTIPDCEVSFFAAFEWHHKIPE